MSPASVFEAPERLDWIIDNRPSSSKCFGKRRRAHFNRSRHENAWHRMQRQARELVITYPFCVGYTNSTPEL
jgi:hypothetical protein